ncbi:MAG: hypothetical protein QM495_12185 [Lutibacter sp.]|uniref:tetratricopeptide repeat protein n=1 Tax=Lutibacter sp. TaxID=1925666 RepID=UPI00385CAB29
MKSGKWHTLVLIGIIIISTFSHAQTINTKEESKLKFQEYFFEALKQKAINNYSKAIENLEKCYEIDSINLGVEFEFSKNFLLQKNYFEAELFINKALAKEPNNNYLLVHKVKILKEQQKFKEAIKIQQKIVKINPKYSDKLALLYIQNKEYKKAAQLIIEIEKNALLTKRIKGFKKYLESRKVLVKKIKILTTIKNETIQVLKEKYKVSKEYKTLQEILNKEEKATLFEVLYMDSKNGLELFPAQPFLYKMNGLALNKLGKYTEAIDVLTLGIDFVIDNIEMEANFYEQLSKSYKGLEKYNEALKYKQKAENLRRGN